MAGLFVIGVLMVYGKYIALALAIICIVYGFLSN